jgi:uncharacterized membrane protein
MPSLAQLHPIAVHFVIGLLFAAVAFRCVSLTGRLPFTGPAAAVLLLAGTVAVVLAAQSGDAAHRAVERIPGVRQAVEDHQDWGEWTRDIFLVVAILEVLALARSKFRPALLAGSALVGVGGGIALYEAAARGGALVYDYAGGPGIRSGNPVDVQHLLLAGLFEQALADRGRGDPSRAAQAIGELAARFPADTAVRLAAIESMILDRRDGRAALAALARLPELAASPERSVRLRTGLLRADAYAVLGKPDSERAVLQGMAGEFGTTRSVRERMAKLK